MPFEVEAIGPIRIEGVKQKIKNAVGVEPHRQTLYYNQMRLEDEYQVNLFVFEIFAQVELRVTPLPGNPKVTVLCNAANRDAEAVSIRESDTVQNLRTKLSVAWGLPIEMISLHRFGSHMDDDYPLSDYYVCDGARVDAIITPIAPR